MSRTRKHQRKPEPSPVPCKRLTIIRVDHNGKEIRRSTPDVDNMKIQYGEAVPGLDWRVMPEGNEKYQAYLCSREWAVIRNAVFKRCGCICERCRVNAANAVHHLSYIRKYNERLEDLQAICNGCHAFTHGKSNIDPKPRRKLYLAGKVSKNCWRHGIVKHLRGADWDCSPLVASVEAAGEVFDYIGPFFVSCDHGCYHQTGTHGSIDFDGVCVGDCNGWMNKNGIGAGIGHGCYYPSDAFRYVASLCISAVKTADVLFAWIDQPDCHGTLVEIGYARAAGKTVLIGYADTTLADNVWFPAHAADCSVIMDSAYKCLTRTLEIASGSKLHA